MLYSHPTYDRAGLAGTFRPSIALLSLDDLAFQGPLQRIAGRTEKRPSYRGPDSRGSGRFVVA